ncbi:MAG: hypothetical protein J5725_03130 [Bacteroidales bacterium]|nr:hypothetical protein [Bacteroidales bacterium]
MKRYVYAAHRVAVLEDFAGKDIWVLVYDYDYHTESYIRVFDVSDDGVITFNWVDARDVEFGYDNEGLQEAIDYITSQKLHSSTSRFYLKYPLESYSTSEIIDGLKGKYIA